MRNKVIVYTLFTIFSLILSAGAVLAAFSADILRIGAKPMWLIIPLAILMMIAGIVNYKILIPRYFLKNRYIKYAIYCMIVAFIVPIAGIAEEYIARRALNLPDRIHDYLSPWILVDSISTAALLVVIMVGMGVASVYNRWRQEVKREGRLQKKYSDAIKILKRKIKSEEIIESIEDISELVEPLPDEACNRLHQLSDKLRRELYDKSGIECVSTELIGDKYAALSDFIAAPKYTLLRDIFLKLLIAAVSITAIFDAPDLPNLTLEGLWGFLGMFLVLCLLTYGNKSLSKHFLNRGKLKTYITFASLFIGLITIVMIFIEIHSYTHTIHNSMLPPQYSIIATISSISTILLFFGGITALIVLHQWIRTEKRSSELKTRTAEVELEFLQSQINPHFLFNVLNNTGILIYEEPHHAKTMLHRMREMFEYQFSISDKTYVKLSEEIDFIANFLSLEKSRKDPFDYKIEIPEGIRNQKIPPLILIPFVENASKYSSVVDGKREINIKFRTESEQLIFECSNTFCKDEKRKVTSGGLGISNTRRRLELIYGEKFWLDARAENSIYKITLIIPNNE